MILHYEQLNNAELRVLTKFCDQLMIRFKRDITMLDTIGDMQKEIHAELITRFDGDNPLSDMVAYIDES